MTWTNEQLEKAKELIHQRLLEKGLDEHAFIDPAENEKSDQIRSIVVVLFPYYMGTFEGNLSMYCRAMDYHAVVPGYLNPIGQEVETMLGPELDWHSWADTGPLHDRLLALRSGLGFRGVNQMLINKKYGSFVFIAYMTFSCHLPADPAVEWTVEPKCLKCGRCIKACPGQAMKEDGSFEARRCLSGITQKKGELEDWEKEIFFKEHMIFGCDVCQSVCPYNQDLPVTPIKEFRDSCIDSLTMEDLEGLSRKQFLEKYPHRAFTWRGPAVLRRNLTLLAQHDKEQEQIKGPEVQSCQDTEEDDHGN